MMFTVLALYPIIERQMTKDTTNHHLLQRPRDVPVRTALGAMALSFYLVLMISGGNDVIADKFDISLNAMTWVGRIGCIVLPPIVYVITYRICLGLQQHDREVLEHGIETGVIRRLPHGEFIEVHQPLGPVDEHGHGSLAYGGAPVPKKMNHVGGARRAIRGFFKPIEEPADVELEQQAEAPRHRRERAHQRRAHALGSSLRGRAPVRRRPAAGAARLTSRTSHHQKGPGGLHRGPSAWREPALQGCHGVVSSGHGRWCAQASGADSCPLGAHRSAHVPRRRRPAPLVASTNAEGPVRACGRGPRRGRCELSSAGRSAPCRTRTAARRW